MVTLLDCQFIAQCHILVKVDRSYSAWWLESQTFHRGPVQVLEVETGVNCDSLLKLIA